MNFEEVLQSLYAKDHRRDDAVSDVFEYMQDHHPDLAARWAIKMIQLIGDPSAPRPTEWPYAPHSPRLAYSIPDAARQVSVSAATIRRQIGAGQLGASRYGSRILIPHDLLQSWLDSLPAWEPE